MALKEPEVYRVDAPQQLN